MKRFREYMVEQIDIFSQLGKNLNHIVNTHNFQVAPAMPKGKPGKNVKSMREYRLQLINKHNDTSKQLITHLNRELSKSIVATNVKYNVISPNSSKFPSFTFQFEGHTIDLIIAKGANQGENFEVQTVKNLGDYFHTKSNKEFAELINKMSESNPEFASVEITKVAQRKGSTKKEGIAIENLGEIIGDIVLTDNRGKKWFISLKDVNGNTFSSYSGAASIFDKNGTLQPTSMGSDFLRAFGVDLNKVQAGFDERAGIAIPRPKIAVTKQNPNELKNIFERAWGMNYFYVRRQAFGWKVFWLDRKKLNSLASNIEVTDVRYPNKKTKQISIFARAKDQKYLIEIRNSKAGEYPNDIKFKVL